MKTTPEEFPARYRENPEHQALASVFDAISRSPRDGWGIFYLGARERGREALIFLSLEGTGRYGIHVRGGRYTLDPESLQWHAHGPEGPVVVPDPLQQASDAAMSLRDEIYRQLQFLVFMIPVVVFPDMESDPVIAGRAQRTNAYVVFGLEHLVAELDVVAERVRVNRPPPAQHVLNEAQALIRVMGEAESARPAQPQPQPKLEPDGSTPSVIEQMELPAAGVTIHHVDQLIIQQALDGEPGAQD